MQGRHVLFTSVNNLLDFSVYACNQYAMAWKHKHISEAESAVMEVLWSRHPLSAEDITAKVTEGRDWSTGTVKSLLNRLLAKQAISAERDGRRYLYSPVLARADYLSAEGRGLIDRLFGGQVSNLLTHFSRHEQLSADDIAELKRLIGELENDDR